MYLKGHTHGIFDKLFNYLRTERLLVKQTQMMTIITKIIIIDRTTPAIAASCNQLSSSTLATIVV